MKTELIPEFIHLRAMGYTYWEIRQTVNVSRVTMVKWAKLYKNKIEKERQKQAAKSEKERSKEVMKTLRLLAGL